MDHHLPQITRLVVRAMQSFQDPQTQLVYTLEGLLSILEAVAGTLTLLEQPDGPGSLRLLRMIDVGPWGPKERAARDAYFADPDHASDPFAAAVCSENMLSEPEAHIRQDWLSDDDWYSSEHVLSLRKKANQDSAIYVVVPAVDEDFPDQSTTMAWGLSINRAWGHTQFTRAERDFALGAILGLQPLLWKVWKTPETNSERELARLPLRLRKVLACLMAGDSEKQAANKLGLSQHSVHTYVKQLYERYDAHSRAELLIQVLGSPQAKLDDNSDWQAD